MKKSILIGGLLLVIIAGIIYGVFFRHSADAPAPVPPVVSTKPAEYFEGVITFEDTYTSSNPEVNVEALKAQYGSQSEFTYHNGSYKQVYNGSVLKWVLYTKHDNRTYVRSSMTDTLFYVDCLESNESIVSSELDSHQDTVMGRTCNILHVKANDLSGNLSRTSTYYFDPTITINPEWYENVRFSSHDKIYAIMKSLPIKTIHETENYTVTSVAVSMKKQAIDSSVFQLPHGVVTMKRR
ncbi:MAG: hypothetical protein U0264_11845 [Candidatus Kapaibacterium sp.]